ncbi:hypothetical protein [Meiothermus ruber]|uniref:hypothetical protein n=1 Tax=Meiothermus ruber TaxID=277 RepID=UPI0007233565|nr:hypothetical protein [Meiothermus ruber]GAO75101.1 cupin [Meiothermus ruber H328]
MSLTGFTRTRVAPDHALLTPDTFVRAPLPGWKNTACIVHISPELGARFKMYTVEMEPGGSGEMTLLDIQRFAYVLEGAVALEVGEARHTPPPPPPPRPTATPTCQPTPRTASRPPRVHGWWYSTNPTRP